MRLSYPKQYVREIVDTYTNKKQKAFGFKTTSLTRPLILAELQTIIKENIKLINDKETLEEMLTFVKNATGRPEAQYGYHDDLILGLAIAYFIRPQQEIKLKENKKNERLKDQFEILDEKEKPKKDFGTEINII